MPKVDISPPSLPASAYGESLAAEDAASITMATYIPYTSERYCSPRSSEMHYNLVRLSHANVCLPALSLNRLPEKTDFQSFNAFRETLTSEILIEFCKVYFM